MKMTRFMCSMIVLAAFPAIGEVTYFSSRDVIADFDTFMGMSGDYTEVFEGQTKEGEDCKLTITKDGNQIAISPTTATVKPVQGTYEDDVLAQQVDFIVGDDNDIRGGFEGNKLWASYFINRKSGTTFKYPPGQFGISFGLKMEKNDAGDLTAISYSKSRVMDLSYQPLGRLECLAP